MEMSTLSAMASSSPPAFSLHHHRCHHRNPNGLFLPIYINPGKPPAKTHKTPTLTRSEIRRKPMWANAISTPDSSWDSLGIVAPVFPRLEELDPNNMLLRQRIIFLGSRIEEEIADFIINQLLLLDAEDSEKDIKMFISCAGGHIASGMTIYDIMKQCKADISTICLGLASSMGAFILAAGTKGKRFCMPNSRVMFHLPRSEMISDSPVDLRELQYFQLKQRKILSRITGKPEKQIARDTANGFYMNAWEAKEYGLIDAVLDEGRPGLVAPIINPSEPPPNFKIWRLWTNEGESSKDSLPSEHKLVKQLTGGDPRTDDEEAAEEKKNDTQDSV
ncbi:ATP-dependent Clp protease proteolytic subunit 3, chloroplastic-like protein [Drosera capensis]